MSTIAEHPETLEVTVTPKAIEKIRQTFRKMGVEGGLRLGVLGGGCSGLSYQFKFDTAPRPKDKVFDFDGVQIFVDPKSMIYLKGMTLDYKESLMQSGFVFENPNAKRAAAAAHLSRPDFIKVDYFEILGLPRSLSLDTADLDKRFYALSRKYHPDLYSRRPAAEQQEALDRSALLNDAYRTLKDPIKRALYVLKAENVQVADEPAPPELLEEMFELNELLEEGGECEPARRRFEAMKEELDKELNDMFKSWDQLRDRQDLLAIRGLLNRRKYITNLIEKTNVPD